MFRSDVDVASLELASSCVLGTGVLGWIACDNPLIVNLMLANRPAGLLVSFSKDGLSGILFSSLLEEFYEFSYFWLRT